MNENKKALIIFPTYNEKENIERIVRAVLERDPRISVLIVDDSSPDGTGQIADRLAAEMDTVHVLHRENKEGLGRAYLAGFDWAITRKYDYIFDGVAGNIVYASPDQPDLTDRVLEELNKGVGSAATAEKK